MDLILKRVSSQLKGWKKLHSINNSILRTLIFGWWMYYYYYYYDYHNYSIITVTMMLSSIPFLLLLLSLMALWCSGYHYCTTSFNKALTQVLHRFKSYSWRVGDSWWWASLAVVQAGNKAKCLSSVNHTTKQFIIIIIIIIIILNITGPLLF